MLNARHRTVWTVLSQAASSLSNVAAAAAVAHAGSTEHFGALSLSFATYFFALETVRALTGEVLIARCSGSNPTRLRRPVNDAASYAFVAGAAIGLGMIATGFALSGPAQTALCMVGAAMPFLCAQDAWRLGSIAAGAPIAAARADTAWLAAELTGFALLFATGAASLASLASVWAIGGVLSAIVAAHPWAGATAPSLGRARRWHQRHGAFGHRLCADYLLDACSLWGAIAVAGAVAGYSAVAALGGGRVLLGPIGVLFVSAATVVTSEGVRARTTDLRWARLLPRVTAGALVAGVLCWSALLRFGPDWFGRAVLAESYSLVEPIIVPLGVYTAARAVINMSRASMRIWGAVDVSVATMAVVAPAAAALSVIGAAAGGGRGAAIALAAGAVASAMVWAWRAEAVASAHPSTRARRREPAAAYLKETYAS